MPDAFAHCAELVRASDRDRYLAALFAPARSRAALYALYAFNSEVARVREIAHQPLPGEIRLQWWVDVLHGERAVEARSSPVASALLTAIERHGLATARLIDLVDARRFDLYDDPMATLGDLEAYARKTSSALLSLAAQALAGTDETLAAEPAGTAYAVVGLLRAFPFHAARHRFYLPIDVLRRHGVETGELFAGRSSTALNAALAELRTLARDRLAAARGRMYEVSADALPAFLPVALVRPVLDRLDRSDAFSPSEIPPWRRQWLIWRAARDPARIAG
jgi:15-cis-phytoene synthase